jgi:CO dehydrogenase/acetyl-CoA synthase delta subunit
MKYLKIKETKSISGGSYTELFLVIDTNHENFNELQNTFDQNKPKNMKSLAQLILSNEVIANSTVMGFGLEMNGSLVTRMRLVGIAFGSKLKMKFFS